MHQPLRRVGTIPQACSALLSTQMLLGHFGDSFDGRRNTKGDLILKGEGYA